jgi:hypothetical protein
MIPKLFITLLLCITLTMHSFAQTAPAGSGTEGDPYQIATLSNLRWFSETQSSWDKFFIQTADIDAADTRNWNDGKGFAMIGYYIDQTHSMSFTGHYDGQGHTISHLFINLPDRWYVGFFALVMDAEIKNIGLLDQDITGGMITGSFAGQAMRVNITNCFATGNTRNLEGYAGGILGMASDAGKIENCYFTGSVESPGWTGGIISQNDGFDIENCYVTGTIMASASGGIAGVNYANVHHCYFAGRYLQYTGTGRGILCVNASTLSDSYWDRMVTRQITAFDQDQSGTMSNCNGLNTDQMKKQSQLSNLGDFVTDWGIVEDSTYPALRAVNNAPFAFRDTLKSQTLSVSLSTLLLNDYDYETAQENLVLKVDTIYGTEGSSDYHNWYEFPASAISGAADSLLYRVGETFDDNSDTLWGNKAVAVIVYEMVTGNHEALSPEMTLYPNPCTEGFFVRCGMEETTLCIFDLAGNLVYTELVYEGKYIKTGSLQPGIYIAKVKERVFKLVKN